MKRLSATMVLILQVALSAPGGEMSQNEADVHMHRHSVEELIQRWEDPERAEWQKPELVLARLGDLSGKTVADLGAGSGYFSFPLAANAKRVLALDIDQRMLDYIDQEKTATDPIETRKVAFDDPGLNPGEADVVLIVDTYHHIDNRVAYLPKLRAGMSAGGILVIVDFFKKELPIGPPPRMKLESAEVKQELTDAGFLHIAIDETSLPYQYIVEATVPP